MADTQQKLTAKQEMAAGLLAEDDLTDTAIAAIVGVRRETLWVWKKLPAFKAAMDAYRDAFRERIMAEGFADKGQRIRALNALATAVLAELGREKTEDTPGGMYRVERKISANGEIVEQEVFDKPKADTFRGYLDDIAKELGDRRTGVDVRYSDADVTAAAERLAARTGIPKDRAIIDIRERLKARTG